MPDTAAHATYNTAETGATIGIQAGQVNESTIHVYSTVYETPPGASAREAYEIGVKYLEYGVPVKAREQISDAVARGHDNGEVRFHWVLAMLSKRSYDDLDQVEREQLARTTEVLHKYDDDEWKRALEAICELLDCLRARSDRRHAQERLLALQPEQRDKIERHLELVLTGVIKDSLWVETHERAVANQDRDRRGERVWAYFEPDPAEPRARPPAPVSTTIRDQFSAVAWSGLCATAAGYLGWSSLMLVRPLPILAFVVALAAGYVAAVNGLEWRWRTQQLELKDHEYSDQEERRRPPERGFANAVDHSFTHYFATYVPHGVERDLWLTETLSVRNALRDEIVEIYRESRTPATKIRWLIRYLVGEVRKRWETGALWEYRERYRIARSTKVRCSIALVSLALAALTVLAAVVPAQPSTALLAAIAVFKGGQAAAARWFHIVSERRRYVDEKREYERAMAGRWEAFERWTSKLAETRPSEKEMEDWLYYDKTVLLGQALQHARLAWRDVITYAFLQVPARSYKRARLRGGPWRYSKYDIRLFLVTRGGVREFDSEIDFEHVNLRKKNRNNFSFGAISSVEVIRASEYSYTLALTLMNGPTRNIRITEPESDQPDPAEDPEELARIDLDAAGFAHTLHILEGIAADGEDWINRRLYVDRSPQGSANYSERPSV